VNKVIISNIRDARRRLGEWDSRRALATAAVNFNALISVANATAMVTAIKAVTPATLKAQLITQLAVVKAASNFAGIASVNVTAIAFAIIVEPKMAEIVTQTVTSPPTPAPTDGRPGARTYITATDARCNSDTILSQHLLANAVACKAKCDVHRECNCFDWHGRSGGDNCRIVHIETSIDIGIWRGRSPFLPGETLEYAGKPITSTTGDRGYTAYFIREFGIVRDGLFYAILGVGAAAVIWLLRWCKVLPKEGSNICQACFDAVLNFWVEWQLFSSAALSAYAEYAYEHVYHGTGENAGVELAVAFVLLSLALLVLGVTEPIYCVSASLWKTDVLWGTICTLAGLAALALQLAGISPEGLGNMLLTMSGISFFLYFVAACNYLFCAKSRKEDQAVGEIKGKHLWTCLPSCPAFFAVLNMTSSNVTGPPVAGQLQQWNPNPQRTL
jgi:hypothetical protein